MSIGRLFPYFGSKFRTIKYYPRPEHKTIIEPFCGSASYSCRYPDRQVKLSDADPVIVGVWDFLIKSHPFDILSLPVNNLMDLDSIKTQEARWLIGFWVQLTAGKPMKSMGNYWLKQFGSTREGTYSFAKDVLWSSAVRAKIASYSRQIKHWTVEHKSFEQVENEEATWFIDPPYQADNLGKLYTCSEVDFDSIGNYAKSRQGQVLVCDQVGADYLPFKPLIDIKGGSGKGDKKRSMEALWTNICLI